MIDYPQCYHYGIVINYNIDPIITNKGSAIFLHCSNGSYTAGCISLLENETIYILKWLDNDSKPLILIK